MTLHIEGELFDRVVKGFGSKSKTGVAETALLKMNRRARFKEMVKTALGFTPAELIPMSPRLWIFEGSYGGRASRLTSNNFRHPDSLGN
jgi:hypothetical protein